MNIAGGLKRIINGGMRTLGFEISQYNPELSAERRRFEALSVEGRLFDALLRVRGTANDATTFLKYCVSNMDEAHAQLFQDLLVLFLLDEKRGGYFIEFCATAGITNSNTF